MKEYFKISKVIAKEIEGNSSSLEKEYLEKWLNHSEGNRQLFDELMNRQMRQSALSEMDVYSQSKKEVKKQLNKAYENKNFSSQPNRWVLRILTAAAVTILVALSVWISLYQTKEQSQANNQLAMAIPAGSSKAILTTSAGEKINIGDRVSNFVIVEHSIGQEIKKEGDILSYFNEAKLPVDEAAVANDEVLYNVLEVPVKGEYHLVLNDGTKVFLNAESKIKYPVRFASNERYVEVEGEVFFEVEHNPSWPFMVKDAQGNTTEVLGTRFNVRSYADEVYKEVTLVDGSVAFKSANGMACELQPGKAAILNAETDNLQVKDVDLDEVLGWKTGRFIFNDEPLNKILYALSRWYGIEVEYAVPEVENVRFSVDFKRSKDLSVLLKSFEMTESISFEFSDTHKLLIVKEK